MAEAAARNLLRRALASYAPKDSQPQDPGEWAKFVEGPLWELLRTHLPFRSMPPELKALAARLRAEAIPPRAEEVEASKGERLEEPVDLEDPKARAELATRPGCLGRLGSGSRDKRGPRCGRKSPSPFQPWPTDSFPGMLPFTWTSRRGFSC